ncbi:MAG: hypothetical protein DI589_22355 [Shinella sp.]|nr:MAG: hypothetical protein DI589_22355 [Shinella sp.]
MEADDRFKRERHIMTTTITVKANHGQPVAVLQINPTLGTIIGAPVIVAENQSQDFYAHSAADIVIREIQPNDDLSFKSIFKFGVGEAVDLVDTPNSGTIIGRASWLEDAPSYFVRYVNGTGDINKEWFGANDLK